MKSGTFSGLYMWSTKNLILAYTVNVKYELAIHILQKLSHLTIHLHFTPSSLPVTRAVPSKFHLPATTAPLCASTLFSMRPALEARWNFPVKWQKKLYYFLANTSWSPETHDQVRFDKIYMVILWPIIQKQHSYVFTSHIRSWTKINFAFTIN